MDYTEKEIELVDIVKALPLNIIFAVCEALEHFTVVETENDEYMSECAGMYHTTPDQFKQDLENALALFSVAGMEKEGDVNLKIVLVQNKKE